MRKIIVTLLAISVLSVASAQVKKCGIDTKALVAEQIAAGATHIDMLAKMVQGFDRGILEKAGISFGAQAGQIVTMTVPVEALPLLESSKEVVQYSISHRIASPTCDKTRSDTRTDSVQNGWGVTNATPFDGTNVYIGITDWGFDYRHPNYNWAGRDNLRLDAAWDHFRLEGPAPNGFDYGTLITDRAVMRQYKSDTSNLYGYGTHGTHVAGISAGRGSDGKYRGQAPNARLLFCTFGLGEKEWMDGVQWMKQVAQDSSRRLVVNSSWGMYSFSCLDGTSLLSQAINAWSDEGVVFCTSAGNNGDANFHISRTFTAGTPDTLKTVADWFRSSESAGQVLILWGEEGHDFEVSLGLSKDTVLESIPFFSTTMGDSVFNCTLHYDTFAVDYRAMVEHQNPFDNRPHMQIEVDLATNLNLHLLITSGDGGTVHAWNVANKTNHAGNEGCDFKSSRIRGHSVGNADYGIGEPACAAKTISVAAHSADFWFSDSSAYRTGLLAYFSSYGPLINGTQKPEISAPGVNVISSISSQTTGSYPAYMTKVIGEEKFIWSEMSGTSMSSPAVTGVIALILQANPQLSVDEIREIIKVTARNDDKTGPLLARDSADVRWGWGKIDALKAVNMALSRVSVSQVEDLHTPLYVYPNPATNRVQVNTGCGEPQTLDVFTVEGRRILSTTVNTETSLNVGSWNPGVYILRVGSRSQKLIVK